MREETGVHIPKIHLSVEEVGKEFKKQNETKIPGPR